MSSARSETKVSLGPPLAVSLSPGRPIGTLWLSLPKPDLACTALGPGWDVVVTAVEPGGGVGVAGQVSWPALGSEGCL